jgi:hypothetical protein
VYHKKLDELTANIKSGKMFGSCNAGMLLQHNTYSFIFVCF